MSAIFVEEVLAHEERRDAGKDAARVVFLKIRSVPGWRGPPASMLSLRRRALTAAHFCARSR